VETLAQISGRDAQTVAQDLAEVGILKPSSLEGLDFEKLEATSLWSRVLETLSEIGTVTHFDTETGVLPVGHDRLIESFAENSAGVFRPEAASEIWHGDESDAGLQNDLEPLATGADSGYTVAFIHGGRLYRFACRDFGDWYDVESVVAAINRALDDEGAAERFIALYTGGQDSAYLFSDPKPVAEAAESGLLFLAASDTAAMDAGKAFEQKALEYLKSKSR
jgi:hypothetical protein